MKVLPANRLGIGHNGPHVTISPNGRGPEGYRETHRRAETGRVNRTGTAASASASES